MRRLEHDGVISGYSADIDPEALGLPLAAIIALTPRDPEHEYDLPDRIGDLSEIESCHSVAGEDSFVLFVRVATPEGAGGADPRDPPPGRRDHPHHGRAADPVRAAGAPADPHRPL